MEHETFSPTLLEVSRNAIGTVLQAYMAATGCASTRIMRITTGDSAFAAGYLQRGFTVTSYDRFMGRMSGIWPDGLAWPASVPRPEPIPLEPEGAELLAASAPKKPLPVSEASVGVWPDDIPKPKAAQDAAEHGESRG